MNKYKVSKDGRYRASVIVGKDKNGNYIRKWVTSTSPKELDKKLTELKFLSNTGNYSIKNNDITFKEVADIWQRVKNAGLEESTKIDYGRKLKIINSNIGDIELSKLKSLHISNMVNKYVKENKIVTANKILVITKSILNYAVENDYLGNNVANKIKKQKHKSKVKKPLDSYERQVILDMAKKYNNIVSDMVIVLLYTGMRREEIIALKREDIDFKKNLIHVQRAMYYHHNIMHEKTTKNGTDRYIPMLSNVRTILSKYINFKNKYIFGEGDEMFGYVKFTSQFETFVNRCNRYIDKNNPSHPHMYVTPHTLRHTYCTSLYYAGVSLKKAQSIMGHLTSKMTFDLYTHLDDEREKNTTEVLENYFENNM